MKKIFIDEILSHKNSEIAAGAKRFFKIEEGEYGHGDIFLGVPAKILRQISKKYYTEISLGDVAIALQSKYHEVRACSLMMLILQYKKTRDVILKKEIFDLYLANTDYINNWDLVDISACNIVGDYLFNFGYESALEILQELAFSGYLWKQRIAIVSTHYFIKKKDFGLTIKLAKLFLNHNHDLIQKAVGWMLREVGKQDLTMLLSFLEESAKYMPRTMLRYSIEKLDEKQRKSFLSVRKEKLPL